MLSERSRGIVGAGDLALMKPSAWLINTSRGPLVDEAALVDARWSGGPSPAPPSTSSTGSRCAGAPFRRLANVLATPHVGFVTRRTYALFYGETVENLLAWLDGAPIRVM